MGLDPSLPLLKEVAVFLASYALGSVVVGYYLVRWRISQDVRDQGSGGVGASNVGRSLGRIGYAITLTGDALKGSLATTMAINLGVENGAVVLAMFAVVAGHIWPVQLRFRGGKGMGPLLGSVLIYDSLLILIYLWVAFLLYVFFRRLTISGLVAVVLMPAAALALGHSGASFLGLVALMMLILYAHRENIRETLWP